MFFRTNANISAIQCGLIKDFLDEFFIDELKVVIDRDGVTWFNEAENF